MALQEAQPVGVAGLEPVYSAANVADSFNSVQGVLIHFITAGTACTITFEPPNDTVSDPSLGDLDVPDRVLVLGATAEGFVHLPPGFGAGIVPTYTDDTDLTHAVLKGV